MSGSSQENLFQEFAASSAKPKSKQKKKPKTVPVSIRVTEDEKAQLQEMAGTMAIAHYIRKRLFGDDVETRPKRYQQKQYQPKIDHVEFARLLGTFGQSELGRSMLALSLAAQVGDLDVSPEVESKLESACDDIYDIKIALIMALNIKPQGDNG